ncbi:MULTISPECIES: DsbA family oxidoreductase [Rhodomicrobium]|uniref:DsbA family oxidoreductase n=1 Tax=Rhodomicrobium TaxID=1068 RepID=UPI000B4B3EB0|nr:MULTISPECIES: DsbA family oxidoreductase [Rhodomicrobium]
MMASSPPTITVEIISDAICPWCWIGKRRIEEASRLLAGKLGVTVVWKPLQLNPDMPKAGVDRALYRQRKFGSADHSAQLDARVAEAGRSAGLEFRHDLMRWTPNTVDCHRLIWLAGREGCQDAVVEGLFQAYFVQGRNIGDAETMADIGEAAGLDRDRVLALLAGEEGAAEVAQELAAARRVGISGVPTFVVDGMPIVAGAAPAEMLAAELLEALERRKTYQDA